MTPEDFVSSIRKDILEANLNTYAVILAQPTSEVRDEYWRRVRSLYSQLSQEQQETVRLMMRQVIVDTLSSILGVLDGTSILESHRKDFMLAYGGDNTKLNGGLQDLFLAAE